jgi:hypothetical protein
MRRRNSIGLMVVTLPFWFLTSLNAQTQSAQSFDQLQVLVKPGDKVYVRDLAGNVSKGKILGLSSTSLDLLTKSGARELAEADILEIKQWRGDSLVNGAVIGATAGGLIGLLPIIAMCSEVRNCAGPAAVGIALSAGIGAGIGVGFDALIPHKQTIYNGSSRALNRFKVSPVLGQSRKGVAVGFSF